MRFSTVQAFNQNLKSLNQLQAENFKTQQQISTGKRVLTPADDPAAAVKIIQLNEELALSEQYMSNMDSAELQLNAEETQIKSAENLLIRVRELAVQSGNAALKSNDRRSIANEMEEIRDQLLTIANAKNSDGQYIFAGFQSRNQPFVAGEDGQVAFVGDEGQRFVKIGASTKVAMNTPGNDIFMKTPASENTFSTHIHPDNTSDPQAIISAGVITDQATFDAFYPQDLTIRFDDPPTSFDIIRQSDGAEIASDQAFATGTPIDIEGLQFEINGAPAAGDRFMIKSSSTQSIFETIDKLTDSLKSYQDTGNAAESEKLSGDIASALIDFDSSLDSMLQARTSVGARLNVVESTRNLQQDMTLLNEKLLSDVQDIDYNEAISRLSLQSFMLQAAQQSYAKISNLSLFNFLR
jgi:flagellar hook-associated protein 3 FlgL